MSTHAGRRRRLQTSAGRLHVTRPQAAPRPHYAGGIWKRTNHRSVWICVWGKPGQWSHVIMVTSSFSNSSVSKRFSVHMQSRSSFRLKSVFKKLRFSDGISVDGRPNRRNKAAFFSDFSPLDFTWVPHSPLPPRLHKKKKSRKKITLNFTMQLLIVVHLRFLTKPLEVWCFFFLLKFQALV